MSNRRITAQMRIQRRHMVGVNLIEIMVAMAIGLFLVLGATTLYVNTKKAADIDDATARLQETARYAMSVIESDVLMANYWGLSKDSSAFPNTRTNETADDTDKSASEDDNDVGRALSISTTANACGTGTAYDIENYVQATDADYGYSGSCAASSGALATADTLTIRHATLSVQTKNTTKVQICAARVVPTIMTGSMPCSGEIHDLQTSIYYIDRQSDQGSGVPSLRRKKLIAGPAFQDEEVVPGVEDMQIELGWAQPNAAKKPTSSAVMYLAPGNTALGSSGSAIVSVRVWLLVRAETADMSFRDTRSYMYASRTGTTGTADLTDTTAKNQQYRPNDNFRRVWMMRTFFIRNAVNT